ncbi:MAG TPA: ROK family protein [Caulobacteraceae bacterium]|jgi:fructokinase|nr:ROK family protein [Caulobacteraceae bacterium]
MIRIGVDFGGTKVEAAALDPQGRFVARVRGPNPGEYRAAIETVVRLVAEAEREAGVAGATIGVGMPGSISPRTGLVRNSNSVWLNGTPFDQDLAHALGRSIRVQNDANCFALSEATDGAAAGAGIVFGAILGTGCGGGVVAGGQLVEGVNRIGGEWGHTPLPWPTEHERAAHTCWCGRTDCLETWISGSAFRADYQAATGRGLGGPAIVAAAGAGDAEAQAALDRYVERLGRAFAVICDIFDPDVIVCGGGMSNIPMLYAATPPVVERHVFSDSFATRVVPAIHGDSSGVRGAAWLWPLS